jgi:superoxide dismutase, Cu-Zn family
MQASVTVHVAIPFESERLISGGFRDGRIFAEGSVMKTVLPFICLSTALICCGCNKNEADNSANKTSDDPDPKQMVVATASLSPASDSKVRGTVDFIQEGDQVRVEASFSGLTPGEHGFHIHEKGDCSAPDASSAGGHFNPTGMPHAGPGETHRHVGDFGNLEADASGNARYSKSFSSLPINGEHSIIGKAVIVHAKADDLKTQPTGDAGGRVACGVIEKK